MTEVAIIGCGPAGLLAAHAIHHKGHKPVVYSRDASMSPNARGVFVHRPIPGVTLPDESALVSIITVGDKYVYAKKVYGREDAPTSWDTYSMTGVRGWPIASVYDRLWGMYGGDVIEAEIGAEEALELPKMYALVINTAPAYAICHQRPWDTNAIHTFPSRSIWVRDGALVSLPENTMMYNGRPEDPWYRASWLFGVGSTEYGTPQPETRKGQKVLPTNCDCNPSIHRTGRWGTWTPGVLLHHSFETAEELCSAI